MDAPNMTAEKRWFKEPFTTKRWVVFALAAAIPAAYLLGRWFA